MAVIVEVTEAEEVEEDVGVIDVVGDVEAAEDTEVLTDVVGV